MAIPYNATSPQPGDLLSQSQNDLLTNFGSINTLITQDHITFTGINPGMHKQVSLVTQTVLPTFLAGQVGMYSLLNNAIPASISNQNELFINKTNASGIVQVPATASILGTSAAPVPGVNGGTGWTMLPSGIKLVWGTATTAGGTVTVTLAPPQSFSTTLLSLQGTIISSDVTSLVYAVRFKTSPNPNQFIAFTSTAVTNSGTFVNASFMYLAIGY
jgi:hypothetical protein